MTSNHTANELHIFRPRMTIKLTHANPGQTPEGYMAELSAWMDARRAARKDAPVTDWDWVTVFILIMAALVCWAAAS